MRIPRDLSELLLGEPPEQAVFPEARVLHRAEWLMSCLTPRRKRGESRFGATRMRRGVFRWTWTCRLCGGRADVTKPTYGSDQKTNYDRVQRHCLGHAVAIGAERLGVFLAAVAICPDVALAAEQVFGWKIGSPEQRAFFEAHRGRR